jgi:thiol-disulfide isomerase/thioredoxin
MPPLELRGRPLPDDCVVKIGAEWCGPCHRIAPHFAREADAYPDTIFLTADADDNLPDMERFDIRVLPTFLVVRGGREAARLEGGSPEELAEFLRRHVADAVQT